MKALLAAGTAVAAFLVSTSASAAIVMSAGQFGGPGVHSTPGLSAATVTGTVGTDLVTLTTIGDLLDTSGGGESKFEAHDGLMDDLLVTFTYNYDAVTFNLNTPNDGLTGFNLAVNGGAFNFVQSGLANGQNKYVLTASGGDFIHSLGFTFSGSQVNDIRQIRVGNIIISNPVPEPATWAMMILGMGMVGVGLRLRRRGAALAA